MRKIAIFGLILICFYSCTESNQQKAEKSIKTYLLENLDNPKTYEPTNFSKIDTASITDNYVYKIQNERLQSLISLLNRERESSKELNIDTLYFDDLKKDIKNIESDLINNMIKYRKDYIWAVEHKYRASNKQGAIVIFTKRFILNDKFDIIDTIEL